MPARGVTALLTTPMKLKLLTAAMTEYQRKSILESDGGHWYRLNGTITPPGIVVLQVSSTIAGKRVRGLLQALQIAMCTSTLVDEASTTPVSAHLSKTKLFWAWLYGNIAAG